MISVYLGDRHVLSIFVGHRNILLFISDGNKIGTQEAAYHGVPVLGLPLYGDDMISMKLVEKAGYGISLPWRNITAQSFSEAFMNLLEKPKYV